jgi:hypothetical protein
VIIRRFLFTQGMFWWGAANFSHPSSARHKDKKAVILSAVKRLGLY